MSEADNIITDSFQGHLQALENLKRLSETLKKIASLCVAALRQGGKIIFMGNGGSAADAQHLAAELVGRFKKNRKPWPALALSVNTSILTAVGNDFGFEEVFVRQIEALTQKQDLVIGLSTSGNSKNVAAALKKAKERGAMTIGFLGRDGGIIKNSVELALTIATDDTARIQETHILAGHIICELIERELCR